MDESNLVPICILLYLGGWVACLLHTKFRGETAGTVGDLLVLSGLLLQALAIGLRWARSYQLGIGHAPLSNLYESMVFFSWTMGLIYLVSVRKSPTRMLGIFVVPLVFMSLASTFFMKSDVQPLMPALRSNWMTAHVVACFIGYAGFAVASCASLLYLLKTKGGTLAGGWTERALPAAEDLDEFSYRTIALAFPMFSVGIITGAAWANSAWGTYWSWDPKETWSLIVWLIYAAYLHARITQGWTGNRSAWLSVLGFVASLFCYLGVSLFLSGLHSYATG